MRNYLIKQKINSLFDYWEIDKKDCLSKWNNIF